MTKSIGLCGAHRTGKTTLAIALAKRLNIPYIPINTSAMFAGHHLDPAKPMDFKTRLGIQRRILNYSCLEWEIAKLPFICDRTPIDMMAYTLAEVQGKTLDVFMESELNYYLDDCKKAVEKYFETLILVPPAIPIVWEEGKASCSKGFIDHIHYLCLGLWSESTVQGYAIDKSDVHIDARVSAVLRWLNAVQS